MTTSTPVPGQGRGSAYQPDIAAVKQALAEAGIDPAGFGKFVNRAVPDVIAPGSFDSEAAAPVLLQRLPRITNEHVKEAIVRHLKTRAARRIATGALVTEFKGAVGILYKWAVADTLAFVADPRQYDGLVELAADVRHGMARQPLIGMLWRVKTQHADEVLLGSLTDPDVATHAMTALRRRFGNAEARRVIEPLAVHSDDRVRRTATHHLRQIERVLARP